MAELKILLLEDNPGDAELLEYKLRRAGLEFIALRVDTEAAFKEALMEFKPDMVLADFNLPAYNGRAALAYTREFYPDLPVIMVTGAIGEEMAVELLRSGARDYILKDRMTRLPAAIRRVSDELEEVRLRRESEQQLKEAENKFRTLFETANDGIFLLDESGFVDCNHKGASMYGLTKEGIIGHSPAEFSPEMQPDGRLSSAVTAEKIGAALRGESPNFEWQSLRADKSALDVDITLSRIEFGGAVYLQAIVRDITGRKQAEQALRASESRYRALVENAPMCIHEIGMDGRIISMNPSGLSMMGAENERAVQGFLYLDAVCDADRARIAGLLDRAYAGEASHFEFAASGKDEKIFKSCFVPIKNQNGEVEKLMGITEDISERKHAEEALRLSETKLHKLYDTTGDAVMLLDENGFFDCNRATLAIFGCASREEFCTKHPADLSPPEQPDGTDSMLLAKQRIAAALEQGNLRFEWLHQRADNGKVFPAEVLLSAMELEGKHVLQATVRDITERKQAEEQIRNFAFYDSLTQLPNRRLLNDRLGQTMSASKRSGHYGALLFLDLDNFKPLNDTHGHDAGDLLLAEVAQRISSCVREVDTVARFGGDEFVVMLSDLDSDEAESIAQAGIVAEKIRSNLSEPYVLTLQRGGEVNTIEHRCTSSIGVVLFINHQASPEDLLMWADKAMYQAKEGGRNAICFFDRATGLSQPALQKYG